MSKRLSLAGAVCLLLLGAATASAVSPPRTARPAGPPTSPHVSVRLVPGGGDFDGVLLQARPVESCAGTSFTAAFTAEADGTLPLSSLTPAVSGWPAGTTVQFTPSSVSLQAGERQDFALALTVPGSLAPGTYDATLALADAASEARASAPASFRRCDAPVAGLRIVADGGEEVVFTAGASGCAGTGFAAHFVIESTGTAELKGVRPAISGFPTGVLVTFQPESADLAPGERVSFEASLTLPGTLNPGHYEGLLAVADRDHAADSSIRTSFNRCEVLLPGLRILLEDEATALLLLPGEKGCSGDAFHARFSVAATGTAPLDRVTPRLDGLAAGIAASFSPRSAQIAPGETASFQVSVTVPADLAPGSYRSALVVADAASGVEEKVGATLERCARPRPGVRLVLPGDAPIVRFEPGPGGCAGTSFRATVGVESTGSVAITALTPTLTGLPDGIVASFKPASFALAPGTKGRFEVSLTVATSLAPGGYTAILAVADAASGAGDAATASLERCAAPRLGLRIVAGDRGEIALLPRTDCSGDAYSAAVEVENLGDLPLGAVGLGIQGLPAMLAATVTPPALSLKPGERQTFTLALAGASSLPPGSLVAALTARDGATGAADSVVARLEHCVRPVDHPNQDPGEDRDDDQPLPLSQVTLEHTTSKSAVRPGEILTYTLVLKNVGPVAIRDLVIDEALPPAFLHVRGRTALDGRAFDDPEGTNRCRFRIDELGEGRTATLSFQVVAGPGVALGKAVARAAVHSRQASAGPAEAVVEVTRGSLQPFGIVRGSVLFAGGEGVAGVRLLLDSDREVVTGESGRFEFPGATGGEHMVSLDLRTLGPGDRVSGDDSRLFHLFEGQSAEIEFRLVPRPMLGLKLDRLLAAGEVNQKEMARDE